MLRSCTRSCVAGKKTMFFGYPWPLTVKYLSSLDDGSINEALGSYCVGMDSNLCQSLRKFMSAGCDKQSGMRRAQEFKFGRHEVIGWAGDDSKSPKYATPRNEKKRPQTANPDETWQPTVSLRL
eukprot:scaffold16111_cov152-Skeletonema_dohrnii-CCMP3373.AAC.5